METADVRVNSIQILWRVAKSTNVAQVKQGLMTMGLDGLAPEPPSDMACLRAVLDDAYKAPEGYKYIFRPCDGGYCVVQVDKDAEIIVGSDYGEVVATVKLVGPDDDDGIPCGKLLELNPYNYEKRVQIDAARASAKEWAGKGATEKSLEKLIKVGGGFELPRDSGMYWLAEKKLPAWELIATCFTSASAKTTEGKPVKPTRFFCPQVIANERLIEDAGQTMVDEVEDVLERIEAEVAAGELHPRAISARIDRTEELLDRVSRFERVFSTKLDKLRDQVTRTQGSLGVSVVQGVAADVVEQQQQAQLVA